MTLRGVANARTDAALSELGLTLMGTIYRQVPFNNPVAAIRRIDAGSDNLHTSAIGTIYVR